MNQYGSLFKSSPLGSVGSSIKKEKTWIEETWDGTLDAWKGIANVPSHFVDSFVSLGEDLASWATGEDQEWFNVPKFFADDELGLGGKITQEVGAFAVGMITGSSILSMLSKAGKLGAIGRMATGAHGWFGKAAVNAGLGAGVDFTITDTDSGNLSNLLDMFPILKDSTLTFLRHEDDDSNLEKRLKNAVEGIPLGIATDTLFEGFKRLLKYKRAKIDSLASGDPDKAAALVARETGVDLPPPDVETQQMKKLVGDGAEDAALKNTDEYILAPERLGSHESVGRVLEFMENGDTESLGRVFKNFIATEDTERLISGVVAAEYTPSTWTLEATAEAANRLGEQLGEKPSKYIMKLIQRDEKATRNLAVRLQVYEAKLKDQSERLVKTAGELLDAMEPDTLRLQQFAEDLDDYLASLPAVLNVRRGAARTITAHRNFIMGDKVYRGINGLKADDIRAAGEDGKKLLKTLGDNLNVNGGKQRILELAKQVREAGVDSSLFHKKIKEAKKTSGWVKAIKVVSEVRMANILSGVATQGVNTMGNMLNFVLRDGIDSIMAAVAGSFRAKGQQRMHLSAAFSGIAHSLDGITLMWRDLKGAVPTAGQTFGELREQGGLLYALVNFIEKASPVKHVDPMTRRAAEGMFTPQVGAKNFGLDETKLGGTLLDLVGKIMRAPSFGIMGAMDTIATDMAFNASLSRNLKNYALNAGMSPTVMAQFEKRMRVAVLTFARDGKIIKGADVREVGRFFNEALESARASTFKSDLDPSGTAAHLMRWLNRDQASSQLIRAFVTPFVKTPVNILDAVWSRTPLLARMRGEWKRVMAGTDQVAKDVLRARMHAGGAMYGLGAALYFSGNLTGAHDKSERASMVAAGIPEYSVRIGSTWHSYNRADPLGSFLGILADTTSVARYLSDGDVSGAVSSLIMVGANNVLNKTYMQGLTDLNDLVGDPERYAGTYGVQQAQAMIPLVGLQRSINQVISPEQKELRSAIDRILSATVLRKTLTDKVDMFGEPVTSERTPLALILGIRSMEEREGDVVRMELAKYNLFPKDNLKRILGEDITAEDNRAYKDALGELGISKGLESFITGQSYAHMNDSQRIKALKNLITRYRSAAKDMLLTRSPALRGRVVERKRRVLAALQGSPQGARELAESWLDIQGYRVDDDGDE